MIPTTETTMDASGRLVVPKSVREAAGFEPGTPLRVRYRDGRIEIEPAPREVRIVDRGGFRVAESADGGGYLTSETVRSTRKSLRDRRR